MVFTHKKTLIKKCNALGDLFIKDGIQFKHLALSLKENKATLDIKKFVDKRYKAFLEVKE